MDRTSWGASFLNVYDVLENLLRESENHLRTFNRQTSR